MTEQIRLQTASPADAAKILALLRLLRVESEMFSVSDDFDHLTVADEANNLARINETTDNLVLLAWNGDLPIGIATVARIHEVESAGEVGIAIQKKFWHQGLGTFMMDELLNWGVEFSSLHQLILTVVTENTNAIKLYQKMNFEVVQSTKIKNNQGKFVSALIMKYDLKKEVRKE
ncbi:GNAT family N-acetyltransferase [Paucilactobacillus wasatchensis]|uniref:Acetyltransferase n=1 Tax=Paucilactobacillus wasatchensis TaxID=1335616 RepID=A0A0D0YXG8_9LACO|nr:GNAT family protein [Paucilactobacillus wasatchensis]KIS03924.1 acetyltransferase [Paucilactobacillus wasatchensis]